MYFAEQFQPIILKRLFRGGANLSKIKVIYLREKLKMAKNW